MKLDLDEYYCSEFLADYYSNGLFHPTEAQYLLPNRDITVDEENEFLKIGEIWDDHDLVLGYRKKQNGIWGRYNYNGQFQFFSDTIKEFTESWYQRDSNYWREMNPEIQWIEILNFYRVNIDRYKWKAEEISYFVDQCIKSKQLTDIYIKAYGTVLGITSKNSFLGRAATNMVHLVYDADQYSYMVYYKVNFFDYTPEVEKFSIDNIHGAILNIKKWIKNM